MAGDFRWTDWVCKCTLVLALSLLSISPLTLRANAETGNAASVESESKSSQKTYYVGYTVVSTNYKYKEQLIAYKIAVWYPSALSSGEHTYKLGPSSVKAQLAVDSPVAEGKFPIVFYSHGATGAGTSSFFICELLARNGYIVVAPDYLDTVNAARIDEPVQFDGFMQMKTNRDIFWLREYGLNKAAREGRTAFEYRPKQLADTIELALEWNRRQNSRFRDRIDCERLGLFGHSFGAWTSLLLTGADSQRRDPRVKAVVALSGPVNEFVYNVDSDNDLKAVCVPVLFEYGDREPALGRSNDRALLYDKANAPKMLISIKDADHLSFSGGIKGEHKLSTEYLDDDTPRRTISETTLDFFQSFLKSDKQAAERLKQRTTGISSSVSQF